MNRREELEWSPISADCNPCDYGLWSDIENPIDADLLLTCEELKKRIEGVLKLLENDSKKIRNIIRSFKDRFLMVVDSEGGAANYRKWRNRQKMKKERKKRREKRKRNEKGEARKRNKKVKFLIEFL